MGAESPLIERCDEKGQLLLPCANSTIIRYLIKRTCGRIEWHSHLLPSLPQLYSDLKEKGFPLVGSQIGRFHRNLKQRAQEVLSKRQLNWNLGRQVPQIRGHFLLLPIKDDQVDTEQIQKGKLK